MALTQENEQSINKLPIFQTTEGKIGSVLDTKGTFIIVAKIKSNEKIIFEGSYINGQGFYNETIFPNYIVSVYPNGYFGVSSELKLGSTTNIVLTPTNIKSAQIQQNQIDFINSKIFDV